ncbi:CCA tRNA nucleotidyltransferase [Paenibacillus agaridevorans]|uniref:CCA tRNA nucleotidyltransferase n=1 Tax=Paenibacillus agaridevorans TaxID=171404 RepID=UPI001BE4969D|nr:CCA tRNA nucleotidyltransferase [Paenibacillus agaridevorans]
MNTIELTPAMNAGLPIIRQLEQAGYQAVFVGGAVRDAILGIPVKDIDIATAAKPEEVMELFPRCIPTGLAHGTVTVMLEGTPYEVTTYRKEEQYENYRKPSAVTYVTDLDEDLLRRDFTVNAMALSGLGVIHDPYGGLRDLRRGVLRCVGHADDRLMEDALRMVRAIRFIGVYGFHPSASVWRALQRHRELLRHVAMERILAELDKMMASSRPARCLTWLLASGLLSRTKLPLGNVDKLSDPALRQVDLSFLEGINDLDVRWASVLLAGSWTLQEAEAALESLHMSNKKSKRILPIIRIHESMRAGLKELADRFLLEKMMERFAGLFLHHGATSASDWLIIQASIPRNSVLSILSPSSLRAMNKLLHDAPVRSVKDLDLNGAELAKALGKKPGPWLKESLDHLMLQTALGRLDNVKPLLLAAAIAREED